jgi:hypothetical protein
MAVTNRDAPLKARLIEAEKYRTECLENLKAAGAAEAAGFPARAAEFRVQAILDDAAAEHAASDLPARPIVAGEVVPTEAERPDGKGGWAVRNTLASPDAAAYAASIERTELLTQGTETDVLALGIDAASALGNKNSLETMLAHQLALAHKTVFRLVDKGLAQRDTVELARLINVGARLMSMYQQGLLTLHRIRTGGTQTVTVQYVNVNGGQTLVAGRVQSGGVRPQSDGGDP